MWTTTNHDLAEFLFSFGFQKFENIFIFLKKVPTSGEASPITKDRGGNYRAAVLSTNVVDIFAFD